MMREALPALGMADGPAHANSAPAVAANGAATGDGAAAPGKPPLPGETAAPGPAEAPAALPAAAEQPAAPPRPGEGIPSVGRYTLMLAVGLLPIIGLVACVTWGFSTGVGAARANLARALLWVHAFGLCALLVGLLVWVLRLAFALPF